MVRYKSVRTSLMRNMLEGESRNKNPNCGCVPVFRGDMDTFHKLSKPFDDHGLAALIEAELLFS